MTQSTAPSRHTKTQIPPTVDIDCPRPSCEDRVTCALETVQLPPKPGTKPGVELRITDLADRMAEHYAAQHPTVYGVNVGLGQLLGGVVGSSLDQLHRIIGVPVPSQTSETA